MKKYCDTAFLMVLFIISHAPSWAQDNLSALLPMPNLVQIKQGAQNFLVNPATKIEISSDSLQFEASFLQKLLKDQMGLHPEISNTLSKKQNTIRLVVDNAVMGIDHYLIDITREGITIKGARRGAIFYGLATLKQVLLGDVVNTHQKQLSPIHIDDQPRLPERILMLDPARHFLPLDDLKRYVDAMAMYKFNRLQLHLTDDQGWRIEIKKHPKLTSVGAVRSSTGGMNGPDNGFYSQQQIKELVQYAADRNIVLIPEIDIPGHTVAALAAYPELGCQHTDTMPKHIGKTTDLMLCAANEKVYVLYKDIIEEIAALFPSPIIHLGGDEAAIPKNWGQCGRCQTLKKQLGYKKDSDLMNYFFSKMLAFVRNGNKTPVLWCELDNIRMPANEFLFPYPKDVILVTWRYGLTPKCFDLTAASGNSLIMAPGEFTYFDYPQFQNDLPEFNNWGMPITTLKKVYEFDPGYGLPPEKQAHIIGVAGTLWGEAIKNIDRAFYMSFPRALALSEAAWTQMKYRSWDSFQQRMYPNLNLLMKQGVSFRVPFEIAR